MSADKPLCPVTNTFISEEILQCTDYQRQQHHHANLQCLVPSILYHGAAQSNPSQVLSALTIYQ